jgi:hypothetical protein
MDFLHVYVISAFYVLGVIITAKGRVCKPVQQNCCVGVHHRNVTHARQYVSACDKPRVHPSASIRNVRRGNHGVER